MVAIDTVSNKRFALAWGELHPALLSEFTGDATETGTCSVTVLTLVDTTTDEEIDSLEVVVRDDDPHAEANLNSEPAYQAVEDTLLTIHGLTRASVEITTL